MSCLCQQGLLFLCCRQGISSFLTALLCETCVWHWHVMGFGIWCSNSYLLEADLLICTQPEIIA